jgi:uncharacterized protein (DUF2267 family)
MSSASTSLKNVLRAGHLVRDVTKCPSLFNAFLRPVGALRSTGLETPTSSIATTATIATTVTANTTAQSVVRIHTRWLSTQGSDGAAAGPKTVLRELIAQGPPRTAGELWVEAEKRGMKSKRFMKRMLKQMRDRGEVQTKPPVVRDGGHHVRNSFLYSSFAREQ